MTGSTARVIVHLSDLHFGRVDAAVVHALRDTVRALQPDGIAISGDLTQRARPSEFRAARMFLDTLPRPQLVVPGNHDVPLYNVIARLFTPLAGYRQFITTEMMPIISDPYVWLVGINTTRPTTWKSGRVDTATLRRVEQAARLAPAGAVKILIAHHPFDEPAGGRPALEALTAAGIDVFLTGHLHASYTGHTAHRYQAQGRAAVVVEAATATSTRVRDEANGFNVLRVLPGSVHVQTYSWRDASFACAGERAFTRSDHGWTARGSLP